MMVIHPKHKALENCKMDPLERHQMARQEEREVTKSLTLWFSKKCVSLKAFFGLFCQHSASARMCQIRRMLTYIPSPTSAD